MVEDSAVLPTAVRFIYEAFRIPKNAELNTPNCQIRLFVFGATTPNGPGPPHSRGFLDHTPHTTVGRTTDQPEAETSTWQHTTLTTDRHPCPRWDSNPQSQQACSRKPPP